MGNRQINNKDLDLSRKLRYFRDIKGIERQELASAIGISYQQLYKYEEGINRICASRLFDIAKYLNVSIDCFTNQNSTEILLIEPKNKMLRKLLRDLTKIRSVKNQQIIGNIIKHLNLIDDYGYS